MREAEITARERGRLGEHRGASGVDAFEVVPRESPFGVAVIEEEYEPIRRFGGEAIATPPRLRCGGEVLVEECRSGGRNVGVEAGGGVAGEHQIVGEHDPVPAFDGEDLVAGVAVERHEHQRRCRALVTLGLAAVFDKEVTTGGVRWQHHDQGADHVVGLLRVLVTGEELTGLVHQHRMQLRSQTRRVGEPEVGTDGVEYREEGLVPAALVDSDPRLRDLPRVTNPSVEHRPGAVAVLRRPSDEPELLGLRRADRKPDRSHPTNVDAQVGGRCRPPSRVRPLGAQIRQQLGEFVPVLSTHAPTIPFRL